MVVPALPRPLHDDALKRRAEQSQHETDIFYFMNEPPSTHRLDLALAKQRQIETYINTSLGGEKGFQSQYIPSVKQLWYCQFIVSVLTYLGRYCLSLDKRKLGKEDFELILVVNNPPDAPQRSISETEEHHRRRLEHTQKPETKMLLSLHLLPTLMETVYRKMSHERNMLYWIR